MSINSPGWCVSMGANCETIASWERTTPRCYKQGEATRERYKKIPFSPSPPAEATTQLVLPAASLWRSEAGHGICHLLKSLSCTSTYAESVHLSINANITTRARNLWPSKVGAWWHRVIDRLAVLPTYQSGLLRKGGSSGFSLPTRFCSSAV